VPAALCAEALAEIAAGTRPSSYQAKRGDPAAGWPGRPVDEIWPDSVGLAAILRSPVIAGIVRSLVGPGAIYDHHYAHTIPAGQRWSQPWHADAIIDPRRRAFDVQLFFFFHDTPREMGGTMVLPGSHLRRVNEAAISRYQNFVGQAAMICPAGSLLVCHHGIWHCGQPNLTDRPRTMLKLRLNPGGPQKRLWDTRDLDDPEVARILNRDHRWYGHELRLEIVNRVHLWRHLLDDPRFDLDYWLTRIENQAAE
jgi:ectoine hydroxylase-related dioxygenase (phytanoyl-CoA dioxygenase family)